MPARPFARPASRPLGGLVTAIRAGGGSNDRDASWNQEVVDPGFSDASKWTLSGSGLGTSAVTGGVLQITSTTNVYFALPATNFTPLPAGVWTVTYTILNYVSGSISMCSSLSSSLSSSTDGTTQSANGTYTENIQLLLPGYIGLKGQGAAIVDSMQIDNFTITRAA